MAGHELDEHRSSPRPIPHANHGQHRLRRGHAEHRQRSSTIDSTERSVRASPTSASALLADSSSDAGRPSSSITLASIQGSQHASHQEAYGFVSGNLPSVSASPTPQHSDTPQQEQDLEAQSRRMGKGKEIARGTGRVGRLHEPQMTEQSSQIDPISPDYSHPSTLVEARSRARAVHGHASSIRSLTIRPYSGAQADDPLLDLSPPDLDIVSIEDDQEVSQQRDGQLASIGSLPDTIGSKGELSDSTEEISRSVSPVSSQHCHPYLPLSRPETKQTRNPQWSKSMFKRASIKPKRQASPQSSSDGSGHLSPPTKNSSGRASLASRSSHSGQQLVLARQAHGLARVSRHSSPQGWGSPDEYHFFLGRPVHMESRRKVPGTTGFPSHHPGQSSRYSKYNPRTTYRTDIPLRGSHFKHTNPYMLDPSTSVGKLYSTTPWLYDKPGPCGLAGRLSTAMDKVRQRVRTLEHSDKQWPGLSSRSLGDQELHSTLLKLVDTTVVCLEDDLLNTGRQNDVSQLRVAKLPNLATALRDTWDWATTNEQDYRCHFYDLDILGFEKALRTAPGEPATLVKWETLRKKILGSSDENPSSQVARTGATNEESDGEMNKDWDGSFVMTQEIGDATSSLDDSLKQGASLDSCLDLAYMVCDSAYDLLVVSNERTDKSTTQYAINPSERELPVHDDSEALDPLPIKG